jgi:hypothetical protein
MNQVLYHCAAATKFHIGFLFGWVETNQSNIRKHPYLTSALPSAEYNEAAINRCLWGKYGSYIGCFPPTVLISGEFFNGATDSVFRLESLPDG